MELLRLREYIAVRSDRIWLILKSHLIIELLLLTNHHLTCGSILAKKKILLVDSANVLLLLKLLLHRLVLQVLLLQGTLLFRGGQTAVWVRYLPILLNETFGVLAAGTVLSHLDVFCLYEFFPIFVSFTVVSFLFPFIYTQDVIFRQN